MITRSQVKTAQRQAVEMLQKTGVALRPVELEHIDVVDFGLGELEISGVQILTLVNTEMIAAKLLVLFPNQTEPEHRHPPLGVYRGKEETIRCEWGELYLYGPGDPTPYPQGAPPAHRAHTYTCRQEYILHPGDQVTFPPNTLHWFQAGPEGAVIWSFSTKALDVQDIFTDEEIHREVVIVEDVE